LSLIDGCLKFFAVVVLSSIRKLQNG